MKRFVWVAICGLSSWGCGGGGLGTPVSQFPSKDELEQFADDGVNPLPPGSTIELDEWQMQPTSAALDPVNQSLQELLAKKAASEQARVAPELGCAAREAARVYAGHEALPDSALQGYLVLRCGSSAVGVQMQVAYREVRPSESDEQIKEGLSQLTGQMIGEALEAPHTIAGIGFARGDSRAAIVLAHSVLEAELKDFVPLISGNEVNISGRLHQPAESIVGAINSGSYGVELCKPDRSQKLPNFRLTCPVNPDDQQATFSVMIGQKGRVLMTTVARGMVRRSDEGGLTYQPMSFGNVTQAKDDAHFMKSLHAALNEARAQAKLQPVKLELAQSKTNRRVVGHYFKEAFRGDDENADLIALGVLAGWNVPGAIKGGGVLPGLVPTTRNPARFLGQLLEDPTGRWVLLERDAQSVAIGARVLKPSGLVAMVTIYSFFGSLDHRPDEQAVFEQLSQVRVQNDLPAPIRIPASEVQKAVAQVATGATTTEEALNEAMEGLSGRAKRGVTGYVMETNDLGFVTFPDVFLQPGPLEIAIGITHYKPPGAAWAQYVLLFAVLLPDDASRNMASVQPTRRTPTLGAF
ncbi:MAG TPA: hypothetical protein VHO25_05065 [Polyangiaceae bacterium]|nr:hypothetical protein [Polyangiaceae bacterium]